MERERERERERENTIPVFQKIHHLQTFSVVEAVWGEMTCLEKKNMKELGKPVTNILKITKEIYKSTHKLL